MKRLAASGLAVVLLAVSALLGAGVAGGVKQPNPEGRLHLSLDQLSPRTVHTDSRALTVTGTITNTGDREIAELSARLQLGQRQSSERQLRQAIADPPQAEAAQSEFIDIAPSLQPGQSAPLAVTVPLNAPDGLEVSKTGVYPLLVNVNGTPEYGGPARLAAMSTLLPVLGVPGEAQPSRPTQPKQLATLWPIADLAPSTVAAPYGRSLILADDRLAREVAPGGRLAGLVSAAESVRADQELFGSLCFAIDPDLIQTVDAMSRGYQVHTPQGPVAGQGAESAQRWLEQLRQLLAGNCVVPIPFANADLSALARVHPDSGLLANATGGADTIERLLDVRPVPGTLWPGGSLDERALGAVAATGTTTLITRADRLADRSPTTAPATIAGSGMRAQPANTLLAKAMAGGPGSHGSSSGAGTPSDEPNIATQNGLAALAYQSAFTDEPTSQPLLLAPPHAWNASPEDLRALLRTLQEYRGAGMITPTSFAELLAAPPQGVVGTQASADDVANELPSEFTDRLGWVDSTVTDLQSAMDVDPTAQVERDEVVAPLRNATIRATSVAWQRSERAERAATDNAVHQLDALRHRVTATTPSQPISMASGTSPLPVSLVNALPVAVTVRIKLINSSGLRPQPIPDQTIPANSKIPMLVPTEALRAGQFNVDVALSTQGGTQLGTTARFELTSNEYGAATVIVTATAAGALLLLFGRRIYRRIRASRAR